MAEYIGKVELLAKAVEVEYLGRPRMMVSATQIGLTPSIEVVMCKECKHDAYCKRHISEEGRKPDDFCSYGERGMR